jgi:hypothetical protein
MPPTMGGGMLAVFSRNRLSSAPPHVRKIVKMARRDTRKDGTQWHCFLCQTPWKSERDVQGYIVSWSMTDVEPGALLEVAASGICEACLHHPDRDQRLADALAPHGIALRTPPQEAGNHTRH